MKNERIAKILMSISGIVENRIVSYLIGLVLVYIIFYWASIIIFSPIKFIIDLLT